jgi:hypothetical protein
MEQKKTQNCDNCGEEHLIKNLKLSLGGMSLCPICE